jgi:hypothetical protein
VRGSEGRGPYPLGLRPFSLAGADLAQAIVEEFSQQLRQLALHIEPVEKSVETLLCSIAISISSPLSLWFPA